MDMLKLGKVGDYCQDEHWEEICSDPISRIFLTFDEGSITSIQFGYVKDGALVMSKKYGSQTSRSTRIVRLNHETEFVTGISGKAYNSSVFTGRLAEKYSSYSISSLTFYTNERKHCFEAEIIPPRTERIELHSGIHDRREFGGFFGSYNSDRLSSIGLYL